MLRNALIPLAIVTLAAPSLAQVPPLPCGAGGGLTVRGRIMDPPGGGLDGVACCYVHVAAVGDSHVVRTRGDGSFETCFDCRSPDGGLVSMWATCCSIDTEQLVPRCFDPLTGLGETVDLGDIACSDAPGTDATLLHGTVLCRSGALLEPVVDCAIVHDSPSLNRAPDIFTRTDANGDYEVCTDCLGRDVTVTAQCCGQAATVDLGACPERLQVPTMVCDPCPVPPCNRPRDIEFRGRLVCGDADGDGLPDPVAGCDVTLENPFACGPYATATTDLDGFYSACAPCPADEGECGGDTWLLFESTSCCGDYRNIGVEGCPPLIDMGTKECCPFVPPPCGLNETLVRGRITCVDPSLPNLTPLSDCRVYVTTLPQGPCGETEVLTDANGEYAACVGCGPSCTEVGVIAGCCGAQRIVPLSCADEAVVDLSCGGCAVPPPDPCSPEQTIAGRVTCDADGDGVQDPLAGCAVRVECIGVGGFDTIVITDVHGDYVACLPCTTCTLARATALCCGQSTEVALAPPDCAAARADIRCSDCPPASPCGPADQAIFGRVTCGDAGGQRVPQAGCDVRVECAGMPPVEATTDANGDYAACLPCAGCGFAVVTPLCCGSPITVPLDPGSCLPVRQDVDCGACIPPRPCPGPPSIRVDGALACAQGNGMTPLANSVVILQALDASGDPLADVVTALTDGAGRYRACVPCPVGIAEVNATSPGCNASSQAPAADCPETLSLDTMLCADCSPCPLGSTRLQGQIHCRGGGPVANCAIRVVVTTCSDSLVLDATTDAQGKYKLCVPCPCDDTDVRVTALCCNASRAVHVDRCGPITPLPTLFCPSPCR